MLIGTQWFDNKNHISAKFITDSETSLNLNYNKSLVKLILSNSGNIQRHYILNSYMTSNNQ